MKTYKNLFNKVCSYANLYLAFKKAKKGKTKKFYVIEFELNLEENILKLRNELINGNYKPKPLKNFLIRDPKLRIISKSDFRDRIVHHALVRILEQIFDKTFVYDSCANRKCKGTSHALNRIDLFLMKISKNRSSILYKVNKNSIKGYCLKADIKKYFENVNQNLLIKIISKKIKDEKIISLIKVILKNFEGKEGGVGMPLGNLTSQFFANVYLSELDYFAKHNLRSKYYLRYVDDFVILHKSKKQLEIWKKQIEEFLKDELKLELHPNKVKINPLAYGIEFVGFRSFSCFRILRKKARKRIFLRLIVWRELNGNHSISRWELLEKLLGWFAYAKNANTLKLRRKVMSYFNKNILLN